MSRSSRLLAVIGLWLLVGIGAWSLASSNCVGRGGCQGLPAKFEIGTDFHVSDVSLHCGYSDVSYLKFGSEWWQFSERGSADSIFATGVLRRESADKAVFVVDGVSHPMKRVGEHGDAYCL